MLPNQPSIHPQPHVSVFNMNAVSSLIHMHSSNLHGLWWGYVQHSNNHQPGCPPGAPQPSRRAHGAEAFLELNSLPFNFILGFADVSPYMPPGMVRLGFRSAWGSQAALGVSFVTECHQQFQQQLPAGSVYA